MYISSPLYSTINDHTIQEIMYCILMHYDMCVIVGILKSVYPLHVHMK